MKYRPEPRLSIKSVFSLGTEKLTIFVPRLSLKFFIPCTHVTYVKNRIIHGFSNKVNKKVDYIITC